MGMRDISDQVTTKSRRPTSWAKPLEMIATGSASTHRPHEHGHHRPQLAERGDGRDIAVADGGQRGHGPVGGLRHGAELVGLGGALDVVHAGRR